MNCILYEVFVSYKYNTIQLLKFIPILFHYEHFNRATHDDMVILFGEIGTALMHLERDFKKFLQWPVNQCGFETFTGIFCSSESTFVWGY